MQPLNVPVSTGPQTIKSVKWRYSIISNGDFPKTNTHVDEHNDFSGWSFFMTKFFQEETSWRHQRCGNCVRRFGESGNNLGVLFLTRDKLFEIR